MSALCHYPGCQAKTGVQLCPLAPRQAPMGTRYGAWQRPRWKRWVDSVDQSWGASRDMMLPLLSVEKKTSNNIPLIQLIVNGVVTLKTPERCYTCS